MPPSFSRHVERSACTVSEWPSKYTTRLSSGWMPSLGIEHRPHQVAVVVEPHVFGETHRADVDDRLLQELEARAFVVAEPRSRVATLIDRSIDVVGRNADALAQRSPPPDGR